VQDDGVQFFCDVLAVFRDVQDGVWDAQVPETAMPSRRLTVMGMALVYEYALESARCFIEGKRYAGLAMDRCFYEALVRTLEWTADRAGAAEQWKALPPFAYQEELLRAGQDASKIPEGVRRDRDRYIEQNPDAFDVRLQRFDETRSIFKKVFGLSDEQFSADKHAHVDLPSLVVHSRPLVAEDFFEMYDDGFGRRRSSLWVPVPERRLLELARLILLLSQAIIEAFALSVDVSPLFMRYDGQVDAPSPEYSS
jgi:hypothetical protein